MLEWLETHQLSCWIRTYLGVHCPGCGFQTALLLLLKGNVKTSIQTYPALIPILLFICLGVLKICGMKIISDRALKNAGFVCLAIILISYLLSLTEIVFWKQNSEF